MSDLPTASRVADPGLRALYALENRWQAWLDVEAALAVAQAGLGIIPDAARDAIVAKARLGLMDRGRIDEGFARTGHTLVPLVWELGRIVGEPHGGWVHWGATTQNITQTGDLLVLRQAHGIFLRQIGAVLAAMADLAERGAEMAIAGRTHGQHAVPATFGFKVAVWIDELIRHTERLRQAGPRLFVAMLGGAAGTYASLGAQGPAVQAGVARHLGMGDMAVPARSIGDHLAENICLLGMLAATGGEDRARDLHADEDRVRRGVGAGAAGDGGQFDDAAEAQSEIVPGHHRRRGRGAQPGAAGAGSDDDGARGGPDQHLDDGCR